MHMGGPVPVRGRRAHARDLLSSLHELPLGEARQSVEAEVAVEGEERMTLVRLVFQDNQRTIVLRRRVVGENVDDALERCLDARSRLDEEIDAKMNGSTLVGGRKAPIEERRDIEEPCLIVAADSHRYAGLPHPAEQRLGEGAGLHGPRVGAQKSAADAQVEDQTRGTAQIHVQDGRQATRIRGDPGNDRGRPGDNGERAGVPESRVGEARRNPHQEVERLPRGRFADRDVRIVGLERLLDRGVRHTHRESRHDERKQDGDLALLERMRLVVAANHRGRGGQGVSLPQGAHRWRRSRLRPR